MPELVEAQTTRSKLPEAERFVTLPDDVKLGIFVICRVTSMKNGLLRPAWEKWTAGKYRVQCLRVSSAKKVAVPDKSIPNGTKWS
tara:strand:- start:359 stop:613 length:255 start_codon:yes stop_codon:yes gene_type:complete